MRIPVGEMPDPAFIGPYVDVGIDGRAPQADCHYPCEQDDALHERLQFLFSTPFRAADLPTKAAGGG